MLHKQYNADHTTGIGSTADQLPVTTEQFIGEFAKEAKPAADTALPPPPPPVVDAGGGFFRMKAEEAPKPQEPAPVFPTPPADDADAGRKTATTPEGVSLETFLRVRNMLQAQLFAMIAKSDNPEKYQLDSEQLDLLAEAYAPYADKISGMLPPWVMVVAVEAITTGKMLLSAVEERKHNIRNANAIKTGAPATAFKQAAATIIPLGNQVRTQFKIHADGSYTTHRDGSYAPVGTAEKVNLADMEEVRQVIIKNKWAKFAKAFALDDSYLQKHGIDLEKLYESEYQ